MRLEETSARVLVHGVRVVAVQELDALLQRFLGILL